MNIAMAATTMDPATASVIPRSNSALRMSLIVVLIELRISFAVVLTIFLIFSTLAAILFGICCNRVAFMDGFMALSVEVTFFMGPCLINEDNRLVVLFTAKLYSVEGMK
jgi:hypothetical protein